MNNITVDFICEYRFKNNDGPIKYESPDLDDVIAYKNRIERNKPDKLEGPIVIKKRTIEILF